MDPPKLEPIRQALGLMHHDFFTLLNTYVIPTFMGGVSLNTPFTSRFAAEHAYCHQTQVSDCAGLVGEGMKNQAYLRLSLSTKSACSSNHSGRTVF